MNKILLFSDIKRCPPCKEFKKWLDNFYGWEEKIDYIDVSDLINLEKIIKANDVPQFRSIPFMYFKGNTEINELKGNPFNYKKILTKILS